MDLFTFVKSSLPILDVISEHVKLKPIGTYHKGSCPFHSEKDASFTVSPDKQIFYCFGCQAKGDVIAFVAQTENLSQMEAVKLLVDRYKLQVPDDIDTSFKNIEFSADKESYYAAHEKVALWTHEELKKSKVALKYLESRGITSELISLFKIGYFPSGMRNLNRFTKAMTAQGVLLKDMLNAHIVMEGRSHIYSPFEERILFPIKDHVGRYCGFGGRVFKKADERAKYYNSKESDYFIKGKLIFGFDNAKKAMQKNDKAFLVEGYMDAIAMVQHGYENTLATLGTACTLDHLKMIARHASTLYILFDGDKAGQKAILRVAQLCWQVNLELYVVVLPAEHDPASYLQEHASLNGPIGEAQDIFSFFVKKVLGDDFLRQPMAKKLEVAHKVIQLVINIPDQFKQDLLLHQAAEAMQMPFDSVRSLFFSVKRSKGYGKQAAVGVSQSVKMAENSGEEKRQEESFSLEEKIFSAILMSVKSSNMLRIEDDLVPYFSSMIQRLYKQLLITSKSRNNFTDVFNTLLDSLNQQDRDWIVRVSMTYNEPVSKENFEQLMFHFCRNNWKKIVQKMKEKIALAKEQQDTAALGELLKRFSQLKQGIIGRGLV